MSHLLTRFFIFLNVQRIGFDTSWQIRWREIHDVLRNFSEFWIFGKGFGAYAISRYRFQLGLTVDNAYAYLLWKTGILGLISFLFIHFMFFKRGISVLRKKIDPDEKIFVTTAILNTAGMMFIAFSNCSIAHYRFIFIWFALYACTEIIARRYEKIS